MRAALVCHVCARDAGDSEVAWEVVGGKATVGLLPKLPSSLRLHVYGPLDVLLAMANMLPKASGVAMRGHRGGGGAYRWRGRMLHPTRAATFPPHTHLIHKCTA